MRPAWFGIVLMACSGGGTPTAPQTAQPQLETAGRDPRGGYWCTIDDESFEKSRFACEIRSVGGRLILAKLDGSARLRGVITPSADGFTFRGELYCRWTQCTQALSGTFVTGARGEYRGTFREDPMIVRLMPASAGAFGGEGYGGDSYGDPFGYGQRPAVER